MYNLAARTLALCFCFAALILGATAPSIAAKNKKAKDTPEVLERYRASAMGMGHGVGRTARVELAISRWTTPEQRAGLLDTVVNTGSKALPD